MTTSINIMMTHAEHAEVVRAWGAELEKTGQQMSLSGYLRDALSTFAESPAIAISAATETSSDDRVRFELALPTQLSDWLYAQQVKHQCPLAAIVIAAARHHRDHSNA